MVSPCGLPLWNQTKAHCVDPYELPHAAIFIAAKTRAVIAGHPRHGEPGSLFGAACGLLATNFSVVAVFMMVIGPLVGTAGGALGGAVAADHPRRPRPARSWSAGLFVAHW